MPDLRMKWFGGPWAAPICDPKARAEVPAGQPCFYCEEIILPTDRGFLMVHAGETVEHKPYHFECHFRQLIGGLNHLMGNCSCCGGTEPPDPPEMTTREEAKAAVAFYAAQVSFHEQE